MNEIVIPVEVRNAGAYLAACGVIESVGAFDPTSSSRWERRPVELGPRTISANACVIETSLRDVDLAVALFDGLSRLECWEVDALDGRTGIPLAKVEKDPPLVAVHLRVDVAGQSDRLLMDYWYHRLPCADEGKQRSRRLLNEGKSAWKFWAGRVSLQKALLGEGEAGRKRGLITALAARRASTCVGSIRELLSLECETGSSLNLDSAARPGALDRGFSANEAKRLTGDAAAARPALELLAAIGLSAFFPPRRLGALKDAGPHGTSGFDGKGIRYHLWRSPVPLPIARLLARGVELFGLEDIERLEARRGSAGGDYKRFEYARGVGVAAGALPEEEEDVGSADET